MVQQKMYQSRSSQSRSPKGPLKECHWLYGLRAAESCLSVRPHQVHKILVDQSFKTNQIPLLKLIHTHCQTNIQFLPTEELTGIVRSPHHEGIILWVEQKNSIPIEELLGEATDFLGSSASLTLYFDQVSNPHNLGALMRTAAFLGVKYFIFSGLTSCLSSGACYRVAQGAAEYLTWSLIEPAEFSRVHELIQQNKINCYLADLAKHSKDIKTIRPKGNNLLILGSEEQGAHPFWKRANGVQKVIIAPIAPNIESMNVSVAAGILCYHFLPNNDQ